MKVNMFALIVNMLTIASISSLPQCTKDQFKFTYTSCNSKGERWRVAIPSTDQCEGGDIPSPIKAKDCNFMCDPGSYLNITKQSCTPCPAGTYKPGALMHIYNNWKSLPKGFNMKVVSLDKAYRTVSKHLDKHDCDSVKWTTKDTYIASSGGSCMAVLELQADLLKPGYIEFQYQYTDSKGFFQFAVDNDKCNSVNSNGTWPSKTKLDEWGVVKEKLQEGKNYISWRTLSITSKVSSLRAETKIRKVIISGISTNDECQPCRPGTHTGQGSSECSVCPRDTFSDTQATHCQSCDTENQYSLPGSTKCIKMEPCTNDDYISLNSSCDSKLQTHLSYSWIQPKICSDTASGSTTLPTQGPSKKCPPCNPGMYLEVVEGANICLFCEDGTYSSDGVKCVKCNDNTEAVPMINIRWWNNLPKILNFTTNCYPLSTDDCLEKAIPSWTFDSDNVRSSKGFAADEFQFLTMNISGFDGKHLKHRSHYSYIYSEIEFVFDLNCRDDCTFTFIKDFDKVVSTWYGNTKRTKFKYYVTSAEPIVLNWLFQKTASISQGNENNEDQARKVRNDHMSIYSLTVTNTLTGGSVECTPCPKGVNEHGCILCEPGMYLEDGVCKYCPSGMVLRGDDKDSCQQCGSGLTADSKGLNCISNCKYSCPDGHEYDFTEISMPQHISTQKLFTAMGKRFYHSFNISICDIKQPVQCLDNYTSTFRHKTNIKSSICRTTILPSKESSISSQSISLGDSLVEITTNTSTYNISKFMSMAGFENDEEIGDVHFVFESKSTTQSCIHGRHTILTLRCDPSIKELLQIELPPKCNDGTCDGCRFHFLIRSKHACPKCRDPLIQTSSEEHSLAQKLISQGAHIFSNDSKVPIVEEIISDYKQIRGECKHGTQSVMYTHPKYCAPKESISQSCSMLPSWALQALAATILIFSILICVLIYCWQKNSKLEYKYTKLIVSSTGEIELPPAETCAIGDEEEDEDSADDHFHNSGLNDQVSFTKGGRSDNVTNNLMNKLKKKMKSNKSSTFEDVSLTEHMT